MYVCVYTRIETLRRAVKSSDQFSQEMRRKWRILQGRTRRVLRVQKPGVRSPGTIAVLSNESSSDVASGAIAISKMKARLGL